MTILSYVFNTPLGLLAVREDQDALCAVEFVAYEEPDISLTPLLKEAKDQLTAYFQGRLQQFELPLSARGTPFQQRVWAQLQQIPYGHTLSYAEVAQRINQCQAVRAVGAANSRNPLAIVVPCHRVIGRDGSLTGYAGGIERKAYLLALEKGQISLGCAP